MIAVMVGLDHVNAKKALEALNQHYSFNIFSGTEMLQALECGYGEVMGFKPISGPLPHSPTFVVVPEDPPVSGIRLYRCETYYHANIPRGLVREFQRGHVVTFEDGQAMVSGDHLFYFSFTRDCDQVSMSLFEKVVEVDIPALLESGEMKFRKDFYVRLSLGREIENADWQIGIDAFTDRHFYPGGEGEPRTLYIRWPALSYDRAADEVINMLGRTMPALPVVGILSEKKSWQ
jgi:hypothetical protein